MFQTIIQDILIFYWMYENQSKKIMVVIFIGSLIYEFLKGNRFNERFWMIKVFVRSIVLSMLASYIYFVICITLLSRIGTYIDVINLKPFSVIAEEWPSKVLICENIFLFIPYGVLLYILAKPFRRISIFFLVGIISSLTIEIIQRITHLGRCEVDDILMNSCGMMIGYTIGKVGLYVITFFTRIVVQEENE